MSINDSTTHCEFQELAEEERVVGDEVEEVVVVVREEDQEVAPEEDLADGQVAKCFPPFEFRIKQNISNFYYLFWYPQL
jgi:hypothetical protein